MDGNRVNPPGRETGVQTSNCTPKDDSTRGFTTGYYWKTRAHLFGLPVMCIAFGNDLQGRTRVARGWIAVGQFAVGGIVLAQFGAGIIGIGQFVFGLAALGQLALGLLVGFGQLSVGLFAVGQLVVGMYGMGQMGWATYLWSPERTDMEAVSMFHSVTWLFQQEPSTVWDAAKFGLGLLCDWVLSFFT